MRDGRPESFGVIGLGRFGLALAKALAESGAEVIAVDKDEEKLKYMREYVQDALMVGKLTREALEDAGIKECGTVIICISESIDVSMLTTLNVLNLGVPRVIAKAESLEHGIILERIGADVVYPEAETATRLASVLLGSKALDIMRLNGGYVISEIKITEKLYGKRIKDLHLEKYDLKPVSLEYEPDWTITDFSDEEILDRGDAIVVIGKFADVEKFQRREVNDR